MTISNSTNKDQGAIGEFAVGEFSSPGAPDWIVGNLWPVWSEPVRQKIAPALAIALIASGTFQALIPEQGTLSGAYNYAWSEPVRIKPGLRPELQQFLAYTAAGTQNVPNNDFAEQSQFDKWSYAWSEPVRLKPGLRSEHQQSFTSDFLPAPTYNNMAWYVSLSDPVRVPLRLLESNQAFYTANILPIVSFGWYGALTEPVRVRPSIATSDQQFLFEEPQPEVIDQMAWFAGLSEPVRLKRGLSMTLQYTVTSSPFVSNPFSQSYVIV